MVDKEQESLLNMAANLIQIAAALIATAKWVASQKGKPPKPPKRRKQKR